MNFELRKCNTVYQIAINGQPTSRTRMWTDKQ